MLQRPMYTGLDAVMNAFNDINIEGYHYSVWSSVRDIAFQYVGDDAEKGCDLLQTNLTALEQSGNDELFYLKFHPTAEKGYITKKSTVICSFPFRLNGIGEGSINGGMTEHAQNTFSYKMYDAINLLKELPNQLKTELNSFDARLKAIEEYEPDEPEIQPLEKYIGIISGLASKPEVMGLITGLISKFMPQPLQQKAINGMNEQAPPITPASQNNAVIDNQVQQSPVNEEIMNNALIRLHPFCKLDTDLSLLADLAETNKPMFDMVLMNLRSFKK